MPRVLPWFGLSAVVLMLDLYSKHLIQAAFQFGERMPVTSYFDLVRYHNTGAAFSFLADAGGWQHGFFVGISGIASCLIIILMFKNLANPLLSCALALVLGGALGNLYDRLTLGYVVDFLLFYYQQWAWPAFNVADSAICGGVGLLLLDSFRQGRT